MEKIENHYCFNGEVSVWEHKSEALKCDMRFAVFVPPQANDSLLPYVTFLSGLTCTHENFMTKAGAFEAAANLGIALIMPDTSPRGDHVPDDQDSYDFGKGAGFYIDATQEPWSKNYRMESYITEELNNLVCEHFPLDKDNQGIMGHSMGGHGALTLFLKYPHLYKSVSAFSPIVAPTRVPWGQKAFSRYLREDEQEWQKHDASILVTKADSPANNSEILIDQGLDDQFLEEQLKPEIFENACRDARQKLNLRRHPRYDHNYFFIQSFIEDHLNHHARYIK